jgi:hypothetical protein
MLVLIHFPLRLFEAGNITSSIDKSYPLEEIVEVYS